MIVRLILVHVWSIIFSSNTFSLLTRFSFHFVDHVCLVLHHTGLVRWRGLNFIFQFGLLMSLTDSETLVASSTYVSHPVAFFITDGQSKQHLLAVISVATFSAKWLKNIKWLTISLFLLGINQFTYPLIRNIFDSVKLLVKCSVSSCKLKTDVLLEKKTMGKQKLI